MSTGWTNKVHADFDAFTQEVEPLIERMFDLLETSTLVERADRFHALDRPGLRVEHKRGNVQNRAVVRITIPEHQTIDIERHWVGNASKYSLGGLIRVRSDTSRGGQFMILALGRPIDEQRDSLREGWWDSFGHSAQAAGHALNAIERGMPIPPEMTWLKQFEHILKTHAAHNLETEVFTHWVHRWTPGPVAQALDMVSALVDPETDFYEWKSNVLLAWTTLQEKASCEGLLDGLLDT